MLTELLKTEERAKILRYVMFRSSFSVSEISRATGVNKGLVSCYLRLLEELWLLQRDGRKYALLDGALPRVIRLHLDLEKLDLSTLGMSPIEELKGLKGLGLYASWANGTNNLDSDLDVWIRADSLPDESDLARLQRDLGLRARAEVNLLVITPQKLAELKINDPPFYTSLMANSLTIKVSHLKKVSLLKTLDECFERGLLRKVDPSRIKSQQSLRLARDWLSEAEANFEAEAYRSALSSAYLAVFHSARAVLFRDGVREKSHYCIGLYLQTYVENDELEEEWPMLFDRIRSVRHADQYSFQAKPTDEEVISGLHLADSFINRMELLLSETEKRE